MTSTTTTTTGVTTTTTSEAVAWITCESPEAGYRVDHPTVWSTNAGDVLPPCSLFDPEPFEVPEGTEIPAGLAIAITVEPPAAGGGSGSGERVLSEREDSVDGYPATRLEAESTGEGLFPAGMRSTRWIVAAHGERIVARTHDRGTLAYEEKQTVLDRMMETLVVLDRPVTAEQAARAYLEAWQTDDEAALERLGDDEAVASARRERLLHLDRCEGHGHDPRLNVDGAHRVVEFRVSER